MSPAIFFDLDGVLADFVRGAFRLHGRSIPMASVRWGFPEQLGFAGENDPTFWDMMGREFWADLDVLQDGLSLLRQAERILDPERIALLTSPCETHGCLDGKRAWVRKHLPEYNRRLFIGSAKHLFAGLGKVLIDDNDTNADKFIGHGGTAVRVPRPWNQMGWMCDADGHFEASAVAAQLRFAMARKVA